MSNPRRRDVKVSALFSGFLLIFLFIFDQSNNVIASVSGVALCSSNQCPKKILQEPTVTTLAKTQNEYCIGNTDVVLEAKAKTTVLNFTPIIVEIQQIVNQLFIKRSFNCCLQAFGRYNVDPIILFVCVDILHNDIVQRTTASRFPGSYVFPFYPWAAFQKKKRRRF
ncbi:hypothetical protein BD408DRAFT_411910 [Parasitella parasitica]|nr:hypothetical protein BD408DRAFT_411910 [Parasitella parasitica]